VSRAQNRWHGTPCRYDPRRTGKPDAVGTDIGTKAGAERLAGLLERRVADQRAQRTTVAVLEKRQCVVDIVGGTAGPSASSACVSVSNATRSGTVDQGFFVRFCDATEPRRHPPGCRAPARFVNACSGSSNSINPKRETTTS
jgi:hypothetical protein